MSFLHRLLGFAGLIPFLGLSLLAVTNIYPAEHLLIGYAALIYSFLGGVIWSFSLQNPVGHTSVLSVSLMLWAWSWLLMPISVALPLAAVSFALLPLYEHRYLKPLYPQAFMRLRWQLSVVAATSLSVAVFSG
jgi:hypothetical protein